MLCHIFLLCSIIGGVLPVALGAWSPLTLLLIPAYFVGLNAVYLLFLFVVSLLVPQHLPKKTAAFCRFLTNISMPWLMVIFHLRVVIVGKEKLPKEPFVLVSNHRSGFDPLVILKAMPERKLSFISKEANMRLPLAGRYAVRLGFLGIDRQNPLQSLRQLNRAAKMVKEDGYCFGIYPEGTRSRTPELLPFKEGAFLMAKKAGAPLVVLSTDGTEKVLRRFGLRRTTITLTVIEVISPDRVANTTPAELAAYCKERIAQELSKS